MKIIEAEGINKFFGTGQNRVHVLKDMSFAIEEGDFVAIIGQSGSGKSTLMNILGCLDTQSSGVCRIGGVDIGTLDSDELAELRGKRIGFIFQRYNLLSTLSATENVALPAVYSGVDKKARLDRAKSLLADLGLPDKLENKPNELSGGQQQRVSIARALMNGGSIILADEPTGALDSKSGENVMDILTELNRRGHTIIVVTHDHHIAGFASRVIEIKDGSIISDTRSREFVPAPERELPRSPRRLLPVPQGSVRRGVQNVGAGHPRPQDAVRADHARHHHRHRLGGVRGRAGARVAGKDHRQHQLDGYEHHQRLSRARLRRP